MKRRLIYILLVAFAAAAAKAEGLVIETPINGAVVRQGDNINVRVRKTDQSITDVILIGGLLSKAGPIRQGDIMDFPLTVASTKKPGRYRLAAIDVRAISAADPQRMATPIEVIVEPSLNITALAVEPPQLVLKSAGADAYFHIIGIGAVNNVDMTESAMIKVQSSDSNIVRIEGFGHVVAVNAGQAVITANYNQGILATANVVVSIAIPGDLNGDGAVDIDDLHEIQTWLNTKARTSNDARDLNHDGKIDALDARLLVTLCAKPRCAR